VPPHRVHETAVLLSEMNADVMEKVYRHIGHSVIMDEVLSAGDFIFTDFMAK
jgi:hypothetical protein